MAAIVSFGASTPANAACLGLELPSPQTTNICRVLLEDTIVPPVYDCGHCAWYAPECCIPGSCLVFPHCLILEQAGYVIHAGDLSCSLESISSTDVFRDLSDQLIDPGSLVTGGTSSYLYLVGGAQIDKLECAGSELEPELAAVLSELIDLPAMDQAFEAIDIDRVTIVERSVTGGSIFLRPNFSAITLGTLVILQDGLNATLAGWSVDWHDVVWGNTDSVHLQALRTMTHELVHVRQYREVGREAFLNEYLADALVSGYAEIGYEEEAYQLTVAADTALSDERSRLTALVMASL